MTPAVRGVLVLAACFLGLRGVGALATPQGRCVVAAQPSVLVGAAPTFWTSLQCAGAK